MEEGWTHRPTHITTSRRRWKNGEGTEGKKKRNPLHPLLSLFDLYKKIFMEPTGHLKLPRPVLILNLSIC